MIGITLLSGCWDKNELAERAIIIGIAIDKGDTKSVKMTSQVARASQIPTPQKGKSADEKPYWNIVNEGDTVFDIVRGFTHENSRKLYF